MASAVSQMPITMMTRALDAGRSRPHVAIRGSRWTSPLPFTNRRPTIVNTPASPRLNATTRTIPRDEVFAANVRRTLLLSAGSEGAACKPL
jgi:hypothetical protein